MGRTVDLKTTRVWVAPAGTIVDLSAPKLTEMSLVTTIDVTCMLLPASKIPSYDDDTTTSEMSICEGDEIVAITGSKYSGEFTAFQDFTTGGLLSSTDPTTIFAGNSEQLIIIVRCGPAFDAVLATGQKLDLYPMSAGKFQKMRGSGSGFIKGKVKLYPLGGARENVALVA